MTRQKTLAKLLCPKCGNEGMWHFGYTTNAVPIPRYMCKKCKRTTTKPRPPSNPVSMREGLPESKVYLVTAAQNATPIHKGFWKALHQCKKFYKAELAVIPGRYRNPTSIWTQHNAEHEWWDSAVLPFLCTSKNGQGWIALNNRLVILGDVKVQWAAQSPLVGLDALTKDKSGIVGHGSRGMRSIATPQHKHPKIMYTTGACTLRNYTDTKRGAIAKFNHCIGALIVEVSGDIFHVRQLNATKSGSFIDLDLEFTQDGVRPAPPALTITLGDAHHRFFASNVKKATFSSKSSMVNLLKPRYIVWHDVIDFHARNHHSDDDWLARYAIYKEGLDNVKEEFDQAIKFVAQNTPSFAKSVIVSSNHDRAALRWLKNTDFRKDPVNISFYLELAQSVIATARKTEGGVSYDEPFVLYGEKREPSIRFLRLGESFVLNNVEYGFHGDIGPGGSRGSTRNLSRMGIKVTKGHSHVAEILDGCYSAGKCTDMLEYEVGAPSAHTNSHVVHYANGKRAILTVVNGTYCLPRKKLTEK